MQLVKTLPDTGWVFRMDAFDLRELGNAKFSTLKNRAYHALRAAGVSEHDAFAVRLKSHKAGRSGARYALYVPA